MKGASAVVTFEWTVEKNNLVYSEKLGDSDASFVKEVVESQSYKNFEIEPVNLESIGHTQKWQGTRLFNLVKSKKGTTNPIHGKNKWTETMINIMLNYYGLAIRSNRNDSYSMKKTVRAILFHCIETNDKSSRHRFLPQTGNTWCKWQYDKLKGTNTYKSLISIPK